MSALTPDLRQALQQVGTATLATSLFRRGFRNQAIQGVQPLSPLSTSMVGEAFTLRTIPAREDLSGLAVFEDPDHPQRKAVETCPPGAVLVIDSRRDARAASAGGILVARLKARGVAGIVTDGGLRDSIDIAALGFPAFHVRATAPTNLTLHQAIEIDVPIGCGEAPVFPGDVVVGDGDGVIVIPAHLCEEITAEAVGMTEYERFVVEQVEAGAALPGLYPLTKAENRREYERWRATHSKQRSDIR